MSLGRALRSQFAMVSQDVVMFNDTIAANVALGSEIDESRVHDCLKAANLAGHVATLPNGIHTTVGHNATQLSGGQRQRLAIARALMKHADLYIFDDSFSALDFKTDAALRHALQDETRDAAVLIIAQRISTILHADQIVVLKDGEVVGLGTHGELMETCEVYRAIAESQMKGGE